MELELDFRQFEQTWEDVGAKSGEQSREEAVESVRRGNDWPFDPPRPVSNADI